MDILINSNMINPLIQHIGLLILQIQIYVKNALLKIASIVKKLEEQNAILVLRGIFLTINIHVNHVILLIILV